MAVSMQVTGQLKDDFNYLWCMKLLPHINYHLQSQTANSFICVIHRSVSRCLLPRSCCFQTASPFSPLSVIHLLCGNDCCNMSDTICILCLIIGEYSLINSIIFFVNGLFSLFQNTAFPT